MGLLESGADARALKNLKKIASLCKRERQEKKKNGRSRILELRKFFPFFHIQLDIVAEVMAP